MPTGLPVLLPQRGLVWATAATVKANIELVFHPTSIPVKRQISQLLVVVD